MISKFLGWKGWAVIFAAGSFVVFAVIQYIAHLRRKAASLQARVATVEKVSEHQAHVGEAARKAAETAPQKVEQAVQGSRSDNNLDHFR